MRKAGVGGDEKNERLGKVGGGGGGEGGHGGVGRREGREGMLDTSTPPTDTHINLTGTHRLCFLFSGTSSLFVLGGERLEKIQEGRLWEGGGGGGGRMISIIFQQSTNALKNIGLEFSDQEKIGHRIREGVGGGWKPTFSCHSFFFFFFILYIPYTYCT